MQPFDPIILSLILITPLAGAVLLAVLPDRGRLQQTVALIVTLITFGLTLHLPAHWHALAAGKFIVIAHGSEDDVNKAKDLLHVHGTHTDIETH